MADGISRPQLEALPSTPFDAAGRADLKALMAGYERRLILSALAVSGGHQRRAAASLGLLPTTLLEKMKRLGIKRRLMVIHTPVDPPDRALFARSRVDR